MVKEIVIIMETGNILSDDKLEKLIKKIDEQVMKTQSRPQVKLIIKWGRASKFIIFQYFSHNSWGKNGQQKGGENRTWYLQKKTAE